MLRDHKFRQKFPKHAVVSVPLGWDVTFEKFFRRWGETCKGEGVIDQSVSARGCCCGSEGIPIVPKKVFFNSSLVKYGVPNDIVSWCLGYIRLKLVRILLCCRCGDPWNLDMINAKLLARENIFDCRPNISKHGADSFGSQRALDNLSLAIGLRSGDRVVVRGVHRK